MNTPLDQIKNPPETELIPSELDELLRKAVERGEALKMPKPKLHWKQARRKRLEASRKHEARESTRRWRNAYRKTLVSRYRALKRQIKRQRPEWELELGDWLFMWMMAKPALRGGMQVPAHTATGRRPSDVRVMRIDKSLPYRKDNMQIVQGDRRLWP